MKKLLLILFILNTLASLAQKPNDGRELIELMYNANKDHWYRTLCFSQEVLNYSNDSLTSTDVWLEAYQSPGNLILKFTGWDSGKGLLFTNDSIYSYRDGALQSVKYRIHDLVVLGLDINNVPPSTTALRAERCGYDLSRIATDKCMGHDAWVVGDTSATCFWVDRETLLFLKMRRRTGDNSREVEFARYEEINGYPVATVINFYDTWGRLVMVEKYFNVTPNCSLPSSIYNPGDFANARW